MTDLRERLHDHLAGLYKRKSHEAIDRETDRLYPFVRNQVDKAVRDTEERLAEAGLPEWDDEGDFLVQFYDRQVGRVADQLRSVADRIEEGAHRIPRDINDGKLDYAESARNIVHKVQWGVANIPLDNLIDAASDVDRYALTHQDRPKNREPMYLRLKAHLEGRHGVDFDTEPTFEEMRDLHVHEHDGPGTIRNHDRYDFEPAEEAVDANA